MTKEEEFIECLKSNLESPIGGFPPVVQGVVTEVGETFCTVKLTANDLEVQEVMYTATDENTKGFILVPKEGTNVLVSTVGGDENSLYLIGMDEVEKVRLTIDSTTLAIDKEGIIFNGGENGGLINIEALKTNLDKVTKRVDDVIRAIKNAVPVPQDGGAGLHSTMKAGLAAIVDVEDFSGIEDDKIKH